MAAKTKPKKTKPKKTKPEFTIISAKEASALLGVHHTTLYAAASRGDVPCRRMGKKFIFVKETLVRWVMGDS